MSKISRKIFSIVMVLAMMLTIIPGSAFAAMTNTFDTAEEIAVSDTKEFKNGKWFKFTPEKDGVYIAETYTDYTEEEEDEWDYPDVWIKAYTDDKVEIEDCEYGSTAGSNFQIIVECKAGSTYYLKIENDAYRSKGFLKLNERKATAISFIPANTYTVMEKTNGYYDEDAFIYYRPGFEEGDILKVTTAEGDIEYRYDKDEWEFVSANGDKIREGAVDCNADGQFKTPWVVGTENVYEIRYLGLKCSVNATVTKNNVESIEFKPIKPGEYTYKENDTSRGYRDEYSGVFYYDTPRFHHGDRFIVHLDDGTDKTYTYTDENETFVSEDGDELEEDRDIDMSADQYDKPWKLGGKDNYVTIELLGHRIKYPVTIVKNTAAVKKANPMKVSAKKVTLKSKKLKKKTQTVKVNKAFTVKNAKGKVTFKLSKKDKKAKNRIKIAANGKITVKKGLKKGTYKMKVSVKAAGDASYKPLTKTVTLKVVVK